ncbi:hypothetical protein HDU93_000288 [Gonapodya sp. JEL0774]|nr:hypothetical protein HDU93_000288 [Gonapodya sp. JEL0774]
MTSARTADHTRVDSGVDVSDVTRRIRIGLLVADYFDSQDSPDWLKSFVLKWGNLDTWCHDFFCVNVLNTYYNTTPTSKIEVSVVHYDCWTQQLPSEMELRRLDCCIITGSRNAAFETLPWILALKEWIRDNYKRTKLLGLCFGHQIISLALGGTVVVNPRGIEEGTAVVKLSPAFQQIFKTNKKSMRLCVGHTDIVNTPVAGAEVLGSTDMCDHQGMVFGDTVLTLQTHPEFRTPFYADYNNERWANQVKNKHKYTVEELANLESIHRTFREDLLDADVKGLDDMWIGAKILGWIMGNIESDEELEMRRVWSL